MQSTSNASGSQQQDAHQEASINQDTSGSGNNNANVSQSQAQKEQASGGSSFTENQNTDGQVNENVGFDQNSSDGGNNEAQVNQSFDQSQKASKFGSVTMQQSSPTGGGAVTNTQNSSGVSTYDGHQSEHQDQNSDKIATASKLQYGPFWFDPGQTGNTSDSTSNDQSSNQHQNNPVGTQDNSEYANCDTAEIG